MGGIQELNHSRIKIRGIVANAAEIQKSYYYRYRYGYGYGYGHSKGDNNDAVGGNSNIVRKSQSRINKIFKVGTNWSTFSDFKSDVYR